MNGLLRDLLDERVDAAGSPDVNLGDLIAQGERRISRRRRAALAGTVASVALAVGASFALTQVGDDRTSPPVAPPTINPPDDVDVPPEPTDGARPLTYGVGATIYWGDRVLEAAADADGLFVLDEGLAILTGDDGNNADNRLYWTDGSAEVEIARQVGQLTVSDRGSLMVWVDGNDVVIYDTDVLDVVARLPMTGTWYVGTITALEDAAYWRELLDGTVTTDGRERLVRFDVATGTRTVSTEAEYRAEMQAALPARIVVGSAESKVPADQFYVSGSRLNVTTSAGEPGPGFVAATGDRLQVTVPDGYEGEAMYLFQWLDDDRFALVASAPGVGRVPTGDLLTCSISARKCRTVAAGPKYWLLPGLGGVGAED
jgi:hypothetical protein